MKWTLEGHAGQHPVIVTFTSEGEEGCIGVNAQPHHRHHPAGWLAAAKLIGQFQTEASARHHLKANGFVQNLGQYLRSLNAASQAWMDAAPGRWTGLLEEDHKKWSDLAVYTPAQLDAYLLAEAEACTSDADRRYFEGEAV